METIKEQVLKQKKQKGTTLLVAIISLIVLLLMMRDVGGIGVINKYVFIVIIAVAVFAVPINQTVSLLAFVMPLYVGLPGNYITLIFIARILLNYNRLKIKASNLIFCTLAGVFILVQSLLTEHMAVQELMLFPGMILMMLMFSLDGKSKKSELILSYATGVATLGLVMLLGTLRVHELSDLLNDGFRLGDETSAYVASGNMNISIDPNFYSFFAISSVCLSVDSLGEGIWKKSRYCKIILMIEMVISVVVSLIGLSRTFIVMFFMWAILYIVSESSLKSIVKASCAGAVGIFLVFQFMPDVINSIFQRFNSSDMATGNGRFDVIFSYYESWSETIGRLLFGIGIFECEVHCAPLQLLFGGGLVISLLYAGFIVTLTRKKSESASIKALIPLIIVFITSATLPAFWSVNYMFPIFITFYFYSSKRGINIFEV